MSSVSSTVGVSGQTSVVLLNTTDQQTTTGPSVTGYSTTNPSVTSNYVNSTFSVDITTEDSTAQHNSSVGSRLYSSPSSQASVNGSATTNIASGHVTLPVKITYTASKGQSTKVATAGYNSVKPGTATTTATAQSIGAGATRQQNHPGTGASVQQIPPGTGGKVAGVTSLGQCGIPKSISGGVILSSGPYNVGSYAVYACLTGYTLSGTARLLCDADHKWPRQLPQCIQPNNNGGADSNSGLEAKLSGMPDWLAIIVGVAVGLICILLLTCLLLMCLRICGCWKGSLFGDRPTRSVQVYPEKDHGYLRAPSRVSKSTSMIFVGEQENNHKFSPKVGHALEQNTHTYGNGRPPDDNQLLTSLDQRTASKHNRTGFRNYKAFKTGQNEFSSPPVVNVTFGRQAKMPEGRKWMPHSHGIRNFNTSTK